MVVTKKIGISFTLLAAGFLLLNIGNVFGFFEGVISIWYALGSIFLIGLGELFTSFPVKIITRSCPAG